MKLINVTNSYATLVSKQLENTDATYVKVYSLGRTLIVHSIAQSHVEIVIINKTRDIKEFEVEHVLKELLDISTVSDELNILRSKGLVEISMPIDKPKS